jgi:uncharacterized protein (DUF924 family)
MVLISMVLDQYAWQNDPNVALAVFVAIDNRPRSLHSDNGTFSSNDSAISILYSA